MGLIVKSIQIEGFGSYKTKQTVTLNGQGPVAVVGENGAGKSTAVSKALTWCLYGKCPPERMGSGTRAISGKAVIGTGLKKATVAVTLTGDKTTYTITRVRGARSEEITVAKKEGRKKSEKLPSEQTTIDTIIGADYDVFTKTVVRGQGDLWSFSEATDKRKREILDAISGADELERYHEKVKAEKKRADEAHKACQRQADYLEDRLSSLIRSVEQETTSAENWDGEQTAKIAKAKLDLEAYEAAVADAAKHDKMLDDNREARAKLEKEEPTLDRTPYTDAVKSARDTYTAAHAEAHAARQEVAKLSSLTMGDPCPTCTQPVGPAVMNTLTTSQATADNLGKACDGTQAFVKECQEVLESADAWLVSERAGWQARLFGIPALSPELPAAESALRHQQSRVADLESVQNPHIYAKDKAQRELAGVRRDAAVAAAAAQSAAVQVKAAEAWDQALGAKGARAQMAAGALLTIESAANQWLTVLSDKGMSIDFPATKEIKGRVKEEIQTIVRSVEKGKEIERDLLTYSGGERRRINLAVDLGVAAAFTRGSGLALSLLVLDEEVFSGLDEGGKSSVVTALHGAGIADIVIIDHDPRLSSVLNRTLEVSRDSDEHSRIREL